MKLEHSVFLRDPRLAEYWKERDLRKLEELPALAKGSQEVAILCYPDDEGVRLNRGRAGAAQGPERILHFLSRLVQRPSLTPAIHLFSPQREDSASLEARHERAEKRVASLLQKNYRVITLGGGHDYGFADASAYFSVTGGKILNIDAHLDVRPVQNGALTSGTPFYRFAERFGGKNLIEWGILSHVTAEAHLAYAKKAGIKVFHEQDPLPKISGSVGLSICLDAFAGIRGVSAPCFTGLLPQAGVKAVQAYAPKSRWLGLYESAPGLDAPTEDSARLAATLAWHFIHGSAKGRRR